MNKPRFTLTPDEGGFNVVDSKTGCSTWGANEFEAMALLAEAVDLYNEESVQ